MRLSNDTKIQYLNVQGRIYKVTSISFYHMRIEASETDLTVADVPEAEVWNVGEFKNYKVRLVNNGGHAKILDFSEWERKNVG